MPPILLSAGGAFDGFHSLITALSGRNEQKSPAMPLRHEQSLLAREVIGRPNTAEGLVLEGWAQGYMVGSLIIMACITVANMRRGVLLHKLILIELIMGIWQGFWILFNDPVSAWWLSVGAIFLNASWSLHNVIAWMKIKPFLSRTWLWIFIGTIILAQPYWVVEIFANFQYFHGWGDLFLRTRPWEPLARDPWWIITTILLFYKIATGYALSPFKMMQNSPRFGILLASMIISIIFIICDILSVTDVFRSSLPTGINPFWKLSFVFKCLTDSVILDDFKTALDRLNAFRSQRNESVFADSLRGHLNITPVSGPPRTWESFRRGIPSPDADSISHPAWHGKKDLTQQDKKDGRQRQLSLDGTVANGTRRDTPAEIEFITVPRGLSNSSERTNRTDHHESRGAG